MIAGETGGRTQAAGGRKQKAESRKQQAAATRNEKRETVYAPAPSRKSPVPIPESPVRLRPIGFLTACPGWLRERIRARTVSGSPNSSSQSRENCSTLRRCRFLSQPATSLDRKSTRLNSSHLGISYAVFC